MQILAFDTAALTASVAVWRDGRILSELSSTNRLNHSVRILPMIDEALSLAETNLFETDGFAISAGPGSFTGVRIGISTLKGLAFGTGKLCAPVSTLEALAFNEIGNDGIICAVMDAKRGEFYNALFECKNGTLIRISADRAISSEDLLCELARLKREVVICGDGAELFCDMNSCAFLRLSEPMRRVQRAASVACVGAEMLKNKQGVTVESLAPLYLRASGAERKKEKGE